MTTNKFNELIKNKDFVIIDGAIGTELQKICSENSISYEVPEELNFTHPDVVSKVMKAYAENGSDIVLANTFGANRLKLSQYNLSVDETIKRAIEIAKRAEKPVGLDVSTLGQLLEPTGTLKFEEAYELFFEMMTAGEKHGADFIIIETMSDLYETKAALLAAKENTKLPVICSMTVDDKLRTFTGCAVGTAAIVLEGLGADVIGLNCSLGPNELMPVVDELMAHTSLPIMVKPNAGLPDPETGLFNLTAEEFSDLMIHYAKIGVKVLGGCCGTSPRYIKLLSEKIVGIKPERKPFIPKSFLTGYADFLEIDEPKIIGERINPTGKKRFKQALLENDLNYIMKQALEQIDAGAEILDVNVGLPEIDEKEMMVKVVKALQSITDVPLQIDSTKPEVIEAALRVYNGKPLVNSVNGEEEVLRSILPIVKKYGAAVLGLTLDENGIPPLASERFEIAKRIYKTAISYGIKKEDIYIDCLTLTASAEQDAVFETLKAVKMVKDNLGLKTVLGVSNISFGLPSREIVNSTFLSLALGHGLDLPIINPNISAMTGAVRAYRLLSGTDKNSRRFIDAYSESTVADKNEKNDNLTLETAILKGLKNEARELILKRLSETSPLEIIENELVPTLDKVGSLYESGKIYLPQLIISSDTAGVCFEKIKEKLKSENADTKSKGRIIIATVEGDIHDIGKNIVKVLLENYGYDVIDLGKDVKAEVIYETAVRENIKLVGLSALMTTTLPSMERTIEMFHQNSVDCKIMVGGAVLTEEYAKKIGADFYAVDATASVRYAKEIFKN